MLRQDGGQPRFTVAELAPQLEPLLAGLFGALSKPDSDQNEYVMKTVMRVIVFVGRDVRRGSQSPSASFVTRAHLLMTVAVLASGRQWLPDHVTLQGEISSSAHF